MSRESDNSQKKQVPPKKLFESKISSANVLGLTGQSNTAGLTGQTETIDFKGQKISSANVLTGDASSKNVSKPLAKKSDKA